MMRDIDDNEDSISPGAIVPPEGATLVIADFENRFRVHTEGRPPKNANLGHVRAVGLGTCRPWGVLGERTRTVLGGKAAESRGGAPAVEAQLRRMGRKMEKDQW
jgi:hypothetical protein